MRAAETVNSSLASYKMGDAQQAAYSYWMDNLCDTYIELAKPILRDENPEVRRAAQTTLWMALEGGLRLLHPMMPFVTEELWQRLPGRGTLGTDKGEPETIMLAPYPELLQHLVDPEAKTCMAETLKIVRACRSLKDSNNILDHKPTKFHIITNSSTISAKLSDHQTRDIRTLARASDIQFHAASNPSLLSVVGTIVLDETFTVLLDLEDTLDMKLELQRLEKALKATDDQLETLGRKQAKPFYEEKVPLDIRNINSRKTDALTKKKKELEEAIASFERKVKAG